MSINPERLMATANRGCSYQWLNWIWFCLIRREMYTPLTMARLSLGLNRWIMWTRYDTKPDGRRVYIQVDQHGWETIWPAEPTWEDIEADLTVASRAYIGR